MREFLAILGVLFVIAFLIERWATRGWKRRRGWEVRPGEARRWWNDERDGPEGDH